MLRLKPQQYWAIIITLLFHTIAVWFLFFVEIQKNEKQEYEVELNQQEDKKLLEKKKQKMEEIADKQLSELLSNKAAKRVAAGEKIPNNKTSDTKQLQEDFQKKKAVFNQLKSQSKKKYTHFTKTKKEEKEVVDTLQKKQTIFYVGDSRVEYFLAERYRVHLPIPVYKCEGAGKVEVAIIVNSRGQVIHAELVKQRSHAASDCMREAALHAALTSVFSKRTGFNSQKGRIVYQFARQ